MEREFHSYYERTFDTLGDLATLVGPDVSPIVNQAGYYITKLRRINDDISKREKVDGAVYNFILKSFKDLITCFLTTRNDLFEVCITGTGKHYSLKDWNRILDSFPMLINVIGIFKMEGGIEFKLESNGIRVISNLKKEQDLVTERKKSYEMLRKLFAKQTLLTFKIDENKDQIRLDLFLNISHDQGLIYECKVGRGKKISLGFSNLFEQYVIGNYAAENLPEHICLEITNDLELIKHSRVPKYFTQVLGEHQIIHFSFLFRPVSIIIPSRGELKRIASGDTGSGGTSEEKQDVNLSLTEKCRYIDIFDLISK